MTSKNYRRSSSSVAIRSNMFDLDKIPTKPVQKEIKKEPKKEIRQETSADFLKNLDSNVDDTIKSFLKKMCFLSLAGAAMAAGVFVGTHTNTISHIFNDRKTKQR